ncbi:hypothetical protein CEUSTIGMA_g6661.t1 [Chlamydomonas eustigma]|uniref:Uncharacterized protein n=1 Tax=Chlamydomonas eustigma TaxID=1157962 RepID=A0A250X810_9CHLO|nr:hypothetical protein CEUSTIGMA_g6661.t1 [Chlamydomonas eustigma]|eukprot:GAX79221.1 hypothetical protein CEUSTIGMA_g6661.t1 [Chlamydomonas eustigma]
MSSQHSATVEKTDTKSPEGFEREMLERISNDRQRSSLGIGSYWTGANLTLEAQYRLVPSASSHTSLYFGHGKSNPTCWWIKIHPGTATCTICNNEKIRIDNTAPDILDSIRTHACSYGHVSKLMAAMALATDAIKAMSECLADNSVSMQPSNLLGGDVTVSIPTPCVAARDVQNNSQSGVRRELQFGSVVTDDDGCRLVVKGPHLDDQRNMSVALLTGLQDMIGLTLSYSYQQRFQFVVDLWNTS